MKNTIKNLWTIACLGAFLLVGVYACNNTGSKQETQKAEQTTAAQKGKPWPAEIPGPAPQFTAGQLMEVNTNHTARRPYFLYFGKLL